MTTGSISSTRRGLLAGLAGATLAPGFARARGSRLLTFNHTDTPNGSRHAAAEVFARLLSEHSDGRLQVVVFHSGQVGNDPRSIELMTAGRLDFTVSATGSYAGLNGELGLAMLPYLVDTHEQGWALYDRSKWFEQAFSVLPERGVRILSTFEAGFRSFSTREPLRLPEPRPGRPMRVFKNEILESIVTALGFEPRVIGITDVYLALQRGEVFGQENPIDTIWSQRFHEVARYLTLTQHVYSPTPLAMSQQTWSSLSPAEQGVVARAAAEAATFSRLEVVRSEERLLAAMAKAGAVIERPDLRAFRRALQPVHEQAIRRHGARAEALLAEAARLRQSTTRSS